MIHCIVIKNCWNMSWQPKLNDIITWQQCCFLYTSIWRGGHVWGNICPARGLGLDPTLTGLTHYTRVHPLHNKQIIFMDYISWHYSQLNRQYTCVLWELLNINLNNEKGFWIYWIILRWKNLHFQCTEGVYVRYSGHQKTDAIPFQNRFHGYNNKTT